MCEIAKFSLVIYTLSGVSHSITKQAHLDLYQIEYDIA
jgi:hypothetical protein